MTQTIETNTHIDNQQTELPPEQALAEELLRDPSAAITADRALHNYTPGQVWASAKDVAHTQQVVSGYLKAAVQRSMNAARIATNPEVIQQLSDPDTDEEDLYVLRGAMEDHTNPTIPLPLQAQDVRVLRTALTIMSVHGNKDEQPAASHVLASLPPVEAPSHQARAGGRSAGLGRKALAVFR